MVGRYKFSLFWVLDFIFYPTLNFALFPSRFTLSAFASYKIDTNYIRKVCTSIDYRLLELPIHLNVSYYLAFHETICKEYARQVRAINYFKFSFLN